MESGVDANIKLDEATVFLFACIVLKGLVWKVGNVFVCSERLLELVLTCIFTLYGRLPLQQETMLKLAITASLGVLFSGNVCCR
jgi:hypothetical protein